MITSLKHQNHTLDLFRSHGAFLEGHFILSSGLHSPLYLQSAKVLSHPDTAQVIGQKLASLVKKMAPIEMILSPAIGGLIIGHEVARALNIPFVFTEKQGDNMCLRRGFFLPPQTHIAIIEDIITTGRSVLSCQKLIEKSGAKCVGIGSIIQRTDPSKNPLKLSVPFVSLAQLEATTYEASSLPPALKALPPLTPGSRP